MTNGRRRGVAARHLAGAALALLAVASLPIGASEAQSSDPAAERERVRQRRAEVASQLDGLRASDAELEQALTDLATNVSAERAQLDTAEAALEQQNAEVDRLRAEEQATVASLAELESALQDAAVDEFTGGAAGPVLALEAESVTALAREELLADLVVADLEEIADEFDARNEDLELLRAAAEAGAAEAERQRSEVATRLGELGEAEAQQRALAVAVDQRTEAALAEAAGLADLDEELSAQIVAEQQRLAQLKADQERRSRTPPPPPSPPRTLSAAPTPAPSPSGPSSSSSPSPSPSPSSPPTSGSSSSGSAASDPSSSDATPSDSAPPASAPDPASAPAPSAPPPTRSVGAGLSSVGGITVSNQIADQLANLLAAAAADGVQLGGGGYRDPAAQRRLRDQNCPDPVNSSPGDCSPPTARVGQSLHEQGLAIDFTAGGSLIQSRSSAGFRWLAANAASYGFYNLPSEPWHWSVNGN